MSRIGKSPIPVPSGVEVTVADGHVGVKGPQGQLARDLPGEITLRQEDGHLIVERPNDERTNRALHGLTRSLVNNMVVGVAGDFEPGAMKKLLRDTFGTWKNAKVTPPQVAKVEDAIPAGIHLVDRPISQSSIEIGHLGVNRFDPDKFPLKILSYILGEGGFDSRLVREVRSTRGLAYSIGGGVGLDSDRGLFQIACRTKAGSTVEAIQLIRDILKQIREAGPTEEEVRQAKEASINSFVFSVDGTVPFMHAFLFYDFYQFPPDYLQTYRDNLAKVTRDQVAHAARKHIDPDRLVVLVVGNHKEFDRPLASLGLGDTRMVRLEDGVR